MRVVVVLLWLAPAIAVADGAADRDLLVEYRRLASDAARTGNCDPARELATQVKSMDPVFFANEYATDPSIAPCLPPSSPTSTAPVDPAVPQAPPLEAVKPVEAPRVPFYLPVRPAVPPLDGARLLGELVLGGLIGFGGVIVGGFAGAGLCVDDGGDDGGDDFACLGSIVIGGYLVGAVGFGLGVGIVGRSGSQTGSIGAAIGGTVLGGLVSLLSLYSKKDEIIVGAMVSMPILGGIIGFNATRRWRVPSPSVAPIGSLVRLERGSISLGIPFVMHGEQRGIPTTSVPLFSGSF